MESPVQSEAAARKVPPSASSDTSVSNPDTKPRSNATRSLPGAKTAVVMVGLPARGKTYIGRHLSRYLCWLGIPTRSFNVAIYNQQLIGQTLDHSFFDPSNTEAWNERLKVANMALNDAISWCIGDSGQVVIFDAAHVTERRRVEIQAEFEKHSIRVVFLECISKTDDHVLDHFRELKLYNYEGLSEAEAAFDYKKRIELYEKSYEPLSNPSQSYIKLINRGERLIVNNVYGYLPTRMVFYLMNLHQRRRSIYLCCLDEHLPAASPSSNELQVLSEALDCFVSHCQSSSRPFSMWTSTEHFFSTMANDTKMSVLIKPQLRALAMGDAEGMEAEQLRAKSPVEYEKHQRCPFDHFYPRGESYQDLVHRLENIIMELERETGDVLILAHVTVLRCIYGYFAGTLKKDIPNTKIPQNTVIELNPRAFGCFEKRHKLFEVSFESAFTRSPNINFQSYEHHNASMDNITVFRKYPDSNDVSQTFSCE